MSRIIFVVTKKQEKERPNGDSRNCIVRTVLGHWMIGWAENVTYTLVQERRGLDKIFSSKIRRTETT